MKMRVLITIMMLLVAFGVNAQQDVQFSQYVFNGLSVNPAYAGYKEDLYFNAVYRKQWAGFPGAPQTGAVSLDGLIRNQDNRLGVGGQVTWDKLGPQQTLSAYGSFAYRIRLDEADTKRLCLGIGFGMNQYSVDGNALKYIDANDPNVPVGKVSTTKPDARFGIYYYTPKFYVGASVMDLFSLNSDYKLLFSDGVLYSTIKKSAHIYLTAGTLITLSDNVKLKPSFMMKEDFHGPTNLDLNAFALFAERLWLGASYRTAVKLWNKEALQPGLQQTAAVSAIMEYYATENMRIGYSYDFTTSGIASYQAGTHEISIGILIPDKKKLERIKSPRYF
ncbi:MAG: type IX secretion system membrane protein PorP/SprF [Filimonas sp.]|nr:type IX secretion system membrane protein PorP/SprF [Filimonas sp.]